MRLVLLSDAAVPFADEADRSKLEEMRAEWRPLLEGDRCPLVRNGDALTIHTFAGGRINATLAAILEHSGAARVAGFGEVGADEVVCWPTVAELEQVDRLAEVAG